MWALRYEAFVRTGTYPRGLTALTEVAFSPEAQRLVSVYQQLLSSVLHEDGIAVVEQAEAVTRHLLHHIDLLLANRSL